MSNSRFCLEMWKSGAARRRLSEISQNHDGYFIKLFFQQDIPSAFDPSISDFR